MSSIIHTIASTPTFSNFALLLMLIGMAFLFIATIVIAAFFFQYRKMKCWHETTRLALEKGVTPPPMPEELASSKKEYKPDVGHGLVVLAVGLALYFGLPQISPSIPLIGAYITGFVGIAIILSALFNHFTGKNRES